MDWCLGHGQPAASDPNAWALLGDLGFPAHRRPSRACQFQPSQPADLLDLVGQLWGATAAQRMPNAEAGNGGASSASAQGWGLETFQRGGPSRSLTPREQRQLAFRGKSHPGQGIPGLWPPVRDPDRDRAAPTCPARPPPLSRGRAGYRAAGTRRCSPPSLAGPTGTGRRVLTLAGGAGRGRTAPRAAQIR